MTATTYSLSRRQRDLLNKYGTITVLLPWPTEVIGEYGSSMFDGSPVTPESCDRVMDRWTDEVMDMNQIHNMGAVITHIIAGRAYHRQELRPAVNVTIMLRDVAEQLESGVRANIRGRIEWHDGQLATA